jgi:hypothetical protein
MSSTGMLWRNVSSIAGSTTTSPSGLATCEAIFAKCLVRATPTENRKPDLCAHATSNGLRKLDRRAKEAVRARHIGEGFINRAALNEGREITQNVDGGIAQSLVLIEMPTNCRCRHSVRGPNIPPSIAKRLGFVRSGEHNPAPDGNRLSPQRWVEQL